MKNKTTIVIPLHHSGGKHGDNTELRFALRSLETHFKDPYQVVIVGRVLPDWIQNVQHVSHRKGLKSALRAAANHSPGGFFWFYDDCCLLRDMTAREMRVTPCSKSWGKPKSAWSRDIEKIRNRLSEQGIRAWDYSRPHGPYWFDKSMVDESFQDWSGMAGKFPFETWILSKRDHPRRHGAVRQYYGRFREPSLNDPKWFLNYNDKGNTRDLRGWLERRFPEPSCHENFRSHDDRLSAKFVLSDDTVASTPRYIYTANIGNLDYADLTMGRIKDYAKKVEAKLIVIKETSRTHPYHALLDCIGKAEKSEKKARHLWIDLDIVIRKDAGDIFDLCGDLAWAALHPRTPSRDWPPFARKNGIYDYDPYFSTGMVLFDTCTAKKLWKAGAESKHWPPIGDQEIFGVLWRKAGICVRFMPAGVHALGWQQEYFKSSFVHFGHPARKKERIAGFVGSLQDPSAPARKTFTKFFRKRKWKGESASGVGSSLEQTTQLRARLLESLKRLNIKSMLDVPCGDWNWMREVDLGSIKYTGMDIVEELIRANAEKYGRENVSFVAGDACYDNLCCCDLIFCRDMLVHLPYSQVRIFIENAVRSGSKYLAMTTFTGRRENKNCTIGKWRPLNLQAAPFCLPDPVEVIVEDCTHDSGAYPDKSIGIWKIQDLA